MNRLADLLRDADPVRHELTPADEARSRARRTMLRTRVAPPRRVAHDPARRVVAIGIGATLVGVVGLWTRLGRDFSSPVTAAVRLEIRLAELGEGPGLRAASVAGSAQTIYLHPDSIVGNGDVMSSRVLSNGDPPVFSIEIEFAADAAARLRRATSAHLGRPIAILIDGVVVTAPVLRSAVSGTALISATYTKAEAERLAAGIRPQ